MKKKKKQPKKLEQKQAHGHAYLYADRQTHTRITLPNAKKKATVKLIFPV